MFTAKFAVSFASNLKCGSRTLVFHRFGQSSNYVKSTVRIQCYANDARSAFRRATARRRTLKEIVMAPATDSGNPF